MESVPVLLYSQLEQKQSLPTLSGRAARHTHSNAVSNKQTELMADNTCCMPLHCFNTPTPGFLGL